MEFAMKKNIFTLFAAATVLLISACSNTADTADSSGTDYPFETIYGSWQRNGTVGAMGITYMTADEDYMTWTMSGTTYTFTYAYEKTKSSVYTVTWYLYDEDTGTSDSAAYMSFILAFEGNDDIYMAYTTSTSGGMTMERVS